MRFKVYFKGIFLKTFLFFKYWRPRRHEAASVIYWLCYICRDASSKNTFNDLLKYKKFEGAKYCQQTLCGTKGMLWCLQVGLSAK